MELIDKAHLLAAQYADQQVVDAKRLQNPLLDLWGLADSDGLRAPVETLLVATSRRSQIATSELAALAAELETAAQVAVP